MNFPSLFDIPLSDDLCREIDFRAQHALLRQRSSRSLPVTEHAQRLREAVAVYGADACIRHPGDIKTIYSGMTTRLFLAIQELYCDRLGRSVETVGQILKTQAKHSGREPVEDEAVWAICSYVDSRRHQITNVTILRTGAIWAIVSIYLPVQVMSIDGMVCPCSLALIVDLSCDQVIAFRTLDSRQRDESIRLALYDAIASSRQPSSENYSGLLWMLPNALLVDSSDTSSSLRQACVELSIEVVDSSTDVLLERSHAVTGIRDRWSESTYRSNQEYPVSTFELIFDRSLFSIQGTEPRRTKEERLQQFADLRGYSQDPASMLPALRWLLPEVRAVAANGSIPHRGLHYAHELLALWPGRTAQLRLSAESEARAWAYFGDEILCEALALELRRKDGSYRTNR